MRLLALCSLVALIACDSFDSVRQQDSIDAYESYLRENPAGRNTVEALTRLETLTIERARADKTLDAYDAYLARFPKGAFAKKAYEERESLLWAWAESEHTVEAWDKYLAEYPSFEADKVRKAKRKKAAAGYRQHVKWTEPTFEQANLAEDPNGPLNGWKFNSQVTNTGDQTLTALTLTIRYLGADGKPLAEESWPVASPSFGVPVEEFRTAPLKPGETRSWDLLTGDVPAGWSKKVEILPTSVAFAKLKAGRAD